MTQRQHNPETFDEKLAQLNELREAAMHSSPDAEDRWQGFQDAHRALDVPAPPAAFAAPLDERGAALWLAVKQAL